MNPAPTLLHTAPVPRKSSNAKWFIIGGLVLVVALGAAAYFKNKKTGVATVVIDQALEDYAALVDDGLGDADTSALITRKKAI